MENNNDNKNKITIKGAREHNLKNVDLEIPRDKFVVFTGLSGSGKSSLAFDTIYAEGQRRYVESLSSYARQFLGQMEKPNVDLIEGLSPAISIDQKSTNHNPRSTVGTVTEIYDYLRLLYARVGIPHCPKCNKEIKKQTIDQIVDQIVALEEKSRLQILAPVVVRRKGEHTKLLEDAKKSGYVRVRIDGNIYELSEDIIIDKNKKHNIEILIDRIIIKEGIEKRLTESIETCMALTNGVLIVEVDKTKVENFVPPTEEVAEDLPEVDDEGKIIKKKKKKKTNENPYISEIMFSQNFACADCGISLEEIEPRSFSFNNPSGACPDCSGLGIQMKFDPELIVPNPSLSLLQGAISATGWNNISSESSSSRAFFESLAREYNFSLKTPFKKLSDEVKEIIFYGNKGIKLPIEFKTERGINTYYYKFEGILNSLARRYKETTSESMRQEYEECMTNVVCPTCGGKRLKQTVLGVTVGDKNISDVTELPIFEIKKFFEELVISEHQMMIGDQILKEINARTGFLVDVGLDYLTLGRSASTLSGGEAQRIRLATQIGSGLVGVVYILDEPSIGLHQRDNDKLLKTLRYLKDIGNTLIVVEHDTDTMLQSDFIVDIGPQAGEHGGEIIYAGDPSKIVDCEKSITGAYLSGRIEIEIPKNRRVPTDKLLEIEGASENNLKDVNVNFPIGLFTCVTGVSGSGKSSLVNEILYKRLARDLNRAKFKPGKHHDMRGIGFFDKVINIDQSPIGRTPRSNPATYTGLFDLVRDLFAITPEAKMRGYQKGRFSFNVRGGRCEACSGDGIIKIEMHFLPDIYVPCEACSGKRYNRETLEVKYKGKNISDVLEMPIEVAHEFFENHPKIRMKTQALIDVGLSYVRLGQPSTTLSGGEAQRVKLATELSKRSTGKTIYVLDEPTTGLHTADVHKLIATLQRLVDGGNTVVVIEHNLDVIKTADYLVDIGPEGGGRGGEVVVCGTPEEVASFDGSYTGAYLKKTFDLL